jgi:hypothetical protein
LQEQGDDLEVYQNAITILANESRVVSCRWTLVDLFFGSDVKKIQTYFETIDSDQNLPSMSVDDIRIAYYVDMNAYDSNAEIWPVWALESAPGEIRMIPMRDGS